MLKLRLIEKGWETYTGVLVGVQFTRGLSEECTPRHAAMIGNIVRVRTEDEAQRNPSDSAMLLERQATPMSMSLPISERFAPVTGKEASAAKQYSREELEQVATEKGITGLRAIADPIGIKGTSIVKLIDDILNHGPVSAPKRPAESPAKAGVDGDIPAEKDE